MTTASPLPSPLGDPSGRSRSASQGPLSIKQRRHLNPSRLTQAVIALAVSALPAEHRTRYSLEFLSELYGMSRPHQLRHACGVLLHAYRLSAALSDTEPVTPETKATRTSLRCRIGWHAYVVRRNPESGDTPITYRECLRCQKEKDIDRTNGLMGLGY